MKRDRRLIAIVLTLLMAGRMGCAWGQTPYRHVSLDRDGVSWTSYMTWWMDLADLALGAPNLGVDVDLRNPQRMWTQSVALQFRTGADSQYKLFRGDYKGSVLDNFGVQAQYRVHFSPYKHPEYHKGRYYVGPYVEYQTLKKRSNAGVVLGYDFPGVSWGNRYFLEFSGGGNIGYNLDKKGIVDMHFAVGFRTLSIAQKYWKPDEMQYVRNNLANEIAHNRVDSLLELMTQKPVTISMKSATGDSLLTEPVTIETVRRAFAQQYDDPYLVVGHLEELKENSPLPITEPSEYNNVIYRLSLLPKDYDSEAGEATYIMPFRVRIEGYDEAVARRRSFNEALRITYNEGGKRLPALLLKPASMDSMAESASMQRVMQLFDDNWKTDRLKEREVTGLYYRKDGEFEPITAEQMNKRGTYAIGLKFHPQVFETYDSLVTRFTILPDIDNREQEMYDRFLGVYNKATFYVELPWRNGKEKAVTVDDVIAALDRGGMTGYTEDQIELPDSIHYGRNVGTTTYGPALQPLQFIFVVEDSVGLQQGTKMLEALTAGVDARRATWNTKYGLDAHGPLVQGRYKTAAADEYDVPELEVADREELLRAVSEYLAKIDPSLEGLKIEDDWVVNYAYTGLHPLRANETTPDGSVWTVLQFRYRLLYMDGRPRVATANVAYRVAAPK
ncbi:MAG: hypothetical protein IKX59_00080 [Bacteroidales bacterium]|nr:hypothetical protein [Bacteroidales bacterium]